MDIYSVHRSLAQGKVILCFADHAIIEGRKDGLTTEDLENTILKGDLIEDYGTRALFFDYTADDRLPCHAVLEYDPDMQEIVIVTAYIPDPKEWEANWTNRRRKKRR